MINEFTKDAKVFRIKTPLEQEYLEEIPIEFENMSEVKDFFNEAMRNRSTNRDIRHIVVNVAPRIGRFSRRPKPSHQDLADQFLARIESGDLSLVEVDYGIRLKSRKKIKFPDIKDFKLSDCCYETMITIREKIEVGKFLHLIFPGILFTTFFSHPQAPIKGVVVNNLYTVTTTDWEQLAMAMEGLGRIQRRGLYGDAKAELSYHLIRSEMAQVEFWKAMQQCILAS